MLGLLEVVEQGRAIEVPRGRERALLVLLVLHANEPVSPEQLIEELWGDRQPDNAGKALQVYVSRLRKALGADRLGTTPAGYALEVGPGELDSAEFERLVGEGRNALEKGDARRAERTLSEALELWRGPALADFRFESFAQPEIRRLEELQAAARADRVDVQLSNGRADSVIPELEKLIEESPLWERPRGQLMRALYRSGRQADALELYRQTRALLAEEQGLEPSPELQSLERAILNQEPELAAPAPAALRAIARRRGGRSLVLGGVLLAGAAAATIGIVLSSGGGGVAVVVPNSLAVVDQKANKIVDDVAVAPNGLAAGRDAIWVTDAVGNTVSRIDPKTNEVRQTTQVGDGPEGVAIGSGALWVANGLDGTVSRIDLATGQVVQTIPVGNGPSGVAYGEGAVWVANSTDGTVSRLDPDTGRVTDTLPAAIGASDVAVGFGRVWVISPPSGSVVALDPGSGQVLARIGVGSEPAAVAAGAGGVWIANRADDTVSRIDPHKAAVTDTVQVGRGPAGIATGAKSVWVANESDATLSRIDSSRGKVTKTIALYQPGKDVAFSPHGVYVALRPSTLEHRGGTLRALFGEAPASLDPALSGDPSTWSFLTLTNDGLVGFRRVGGVEGSQLVPDLAIALPTPSDGGRTYTFRLRPGLRYSTGKPVQPDDVRRGLERAVELGTATPYYAGIVGADRCAPHRSCDLSHGIETDRRERTITFHLRAPDGDFLAKLALPFAYAVPAGTPRRDVGTHALPATGPYRITSYSAKTHELRLARNPSFRQWSADAQPDGYPDVISWSWRFGLDAGRSVTAVARGRADVALHLSPLPSKRELDLLAARYPSELQLSTQARTNFFFLNTRVPPFDDVRVRRAVNYAFDRDAFTRLVGRAAAPTCQILPPNFPAFHRSCPYVAGGVTRVEAARRLVDASGTAGTRVTVWVPAALADQGRYLVSVLDSLGYRAGIKRVLPSRDYFGEVMDSRLRIQAGYFGWTAEYPSAYDFFQPLFTCRAFRPGNPVENFNPSEFCNDSIDAQIDHAAAVQAQDPPAATNLWQRVEREILTQAPVVPTSNVRAIDFVSKRLGNYQFNPQWGMLLSQAWVR